jgi:tRNA 2-thiouridine synthesizing protein A
MELIMSEFDAELDAKGLACPLPILKAKKAITDLSPGQVIKITATDPGSVKDFAAFATQTENELVSSTENDGIYTFMIKILA